MPTVTIKQEGGGGKKEPTEQEKCERRGGKWVNGACVMPKREKEPDVLQRGLGRIAASIIPGEAERQAREKASREFVQPPAPEPEPEPEPIPDVKPTTPEIFRDVKTGRQSGITLPDGRTFLGLSPEDVADISASELAKKTLPEGTAPVGTAQAVAEDTRRKIALAKTLGNIDFETAAQIEEQGLNVRELVSAGFQNIDLFRTGTALAAGAFAGTSAAIPTGGLSVPVVAGAAAAGSVINDFQKGVRNNIKSQRSDLVTLKTKELRQRKTAIQNYITNANMNPAEADDMVAAMNIELGLIRRDYSTLIAESQPNLEFWGSDGTRQIADYDVFFESVEPSLIARMEQAILKPEPTRAFLSLGEEEE